MRWLIRLYPRRWRERYAEEFEALLRQRQLTFRDAVDIASCALEARLRHGHGQSGDREHVEREMGGERRVPIKRLLTGLSICAAASALVLTAMTYGLWPFAHTASSAYHLYTLDHSHGVRLLPVGGGRQGGSRHAQVVTIGQANVANNLSQVLQSDDGRTVAVVSFLAGETRSPDSATGVCITRQCRETVRIFAVRTGTLRSEYHLSPGVDARGLSPDGSTLAGTSWSGATWYAISTDSGQVVSKVAVPGLRVVCPNGQCSPPTEYDGPHHRLYVLEMATPNGESTRPRPPRLLAYNTLSSREVAHLVLHGVAYGSWGDQEWTPGFALSPDGGQIAVYDDAMNRLTLIDARRMRIQRVESVSRPGGLIGQVAQALGIEPAEAWAKGVSRGADLQMRYSPNGKLLYVTGDETLPRALPNETSIGIRAIDVAHGTMTGDLLKGQLILWIQPTPDGSALYAFAPFGDDAEVFPCILRLDPTTLRIVGQQIVTLRSGNPQYYLLAAFNR